MRDTKYVIYLQSWADREDPSNKQFLRIDQKPEQDFERVWRRNGEWVESVKDATVIDSKDKANQIAWYYGVAFEELV